MKDSSFKRIPLEYLESVLQKVALMCINESGWRRGMLGIDSTGFSTKRYARWNDVRRNRKKRRKDFLKLHFLVDVLSMLILSFKITPGNTADAKQVPYLMKLIYFLTSICADKAYLSRKVCNIIAKHNDY